MASDLHYRLPHYDWLVRALKTSTSLHWPGISRTSSARCRSVCRSSSSSATSSTLAERATVLAASGNHDLDGPGELGEQVAGWLRDLRQDTLLCDGASVDLDGIRFTVCPWWDGPATRDAVAAQLAAAAVDRPATWIWLYHAPPANTVLCNDGRRVFPDHELAAWIEQYQPELVMCGHIHQAPWVDGGSWHAQTRQDVGFQRGQADRPDPSAHHHRYRERDGGVVRGLQHRNGELAVAV